MMKYFCDKCNKETTKENECTLLDYNKNFLLEFGLCDDCFKKIFGTIKDKK